MKSKKALKRSLSAILCAAMLVNPVMTAYATEGPTYPPRSPEITEEYMKDKIPMYFNVGLKTGNMLDEETGEYVDTYEAYFGLKANVSVTVKEIDTEEWKEIYTADLGDFDTGCEETLIAGLPKEIKEKYGDTSKYVIQINVKPLNLPDDVVMSDSDYPYAMDEFAFEYKGEDTFIGEIHLRKKIVHTQDGVLHVNAPDKTVYKIGEEFDATGGRIIGNGCLVDDEWNILVNWDNFGRELKLEDLDLSEFDNTKAGEYLIKVKKVNYDNTLHDELIDKIVYDSFYVNVVEDDTTIQQKNTREIKFNLNFEGEPPKDLCDIEFNVSIRLDLGYSEEYANWVELGKFTPDKNNTITVEVPSEYFDYDKYGNPEFSINSHDLTYNYGNDHGKYYELENTHFYYNFMTQDTGELTINGPYDYDHYFHYGISCPPDKLTYKVGEELDLTGGKRMGSGYLPGKAGYWDDFGSPLTLDMLDISEFDNTKPGEYTIKGKGNVSGEFKVTVYSEDELPQNNENGSSTPETETTKFNFKINYNGNYNKDYIKFEVIYAYGDKNETEENRLYFEDLKMDENDMVTIEIPSEHADPEKNEIMVFYITISDLEQKSEFAPTVENKKFNYKDMVDNTVEVNISSPYDYQKFYIDTPPTKLTYKVGEELDLTGGLRKGSGELPDKAGYLDDFGTPLSLDMLDISEFDNTKPGVYTIKGKGNVSGQFKVTVVDKDKTNTSKVSKIKGDANLDEDISLADAVAIMQFIANPDKHSLSEQAMKNSDITGDNDGVTGKDALIIQKYMLKMIDSIK